ncbi:multidrug effflux MFS transporter [Vibrio sp.]|nr:multidrug effflux MFS transporter [Vibrio sp.]
MISDRSTSDYTQSDRNTSMPMRMVFLLAAIFALTPYAIDSYLPAIPSIANDFGVDTAKISITVSMYIFGLAIGQLIGGPLSDKYGRRAIVVLGLLIFAVCSVVLSTVDTLESFWFWRLMQSIGGGIAVVGVPATIRDHAKGKEAAKLFSLIALIMMIAPSIAPSIGTLIMRTLGWEWIFISIGALAFIIAMISFKVMPKPVTLSQPLPKATFRGVMAVKPAMLLLFSHALSYATLVTFITNAPFAYIVHFGASEELFSALFLAKVSGIVFTNRLNNYLLRKHEPHVLFIRFLSLQLVGAVVLLLATAVFPESIWAAAAGLILLTASVGGTLSNSNVTYMKYFEKNAGTAASLLGASQYFIGAVISAITAFLTVSSLWPLAIVLVACSVGALFFIQANQRLDNT